jgi:hypothetical protein
MNGEVVILDLKSGIYYGLDAVGARIWTLLEEPVSLDAIRQTIMSEYDVDTETCASDVLSFLTQMHDVGLVEITNGSDR